MEKENNKHLETSSTTDKSSSETSPFEKIINLNKLGSLCLASDKFDKAISILSKTMDFYIEKKEKKEIPNFFYSNLYCNLAKSYSCLKQFDKAEPLYLECINNHPMYKILLKEKEFIQNIFNINVEKLVCIEEGVSLNFEEINKKIEIILNFFDFTFNDDNSLLAEFKDKINVKFKPNNLNNLSSFTDSLVNLAVIFQYKNKETITAFNMYYIAMLCEPNNNVANIDFNNFLREVNLKHKSDEYIIKRIKYGYLTEMKEKNEKGDIGVEELDIHTINAKEKTNYLSNKSKISFVCMKWGTKYGADYVNKLYRGIKRHSSKEFTFHCISDNFEGLEQEIRPIKLECDFKGWMRKSILFSKDYIKILTLKEEELICFIDLDMIICGNLDYLWTYAGNFCVMKTDDIQCESSINGYNSSVILWNKDFCSEIFDYMLKYDKWINTQVIRFDHYLEFVVKNSDFIQDQFKGQVLDYNTYCKDKDILPEGSSIIAFPRYPKPHECSEKWINQFWV